MTSEQEWAAIVESGKPIYKGRPAETQPDPLEPELADEWDGIRAAHGRNDYHLSGIFRRVQRRID